VPDVAQYVILNSGVESASPPQSWTVFPNAFEVDYVRVYDRPDAPFLHDGDFEQESPGPGPWQRSGQTVVVGYGARKGKLALRIDGGPSSAEQTVYGLRPKTTYVLTAWVKMVTDDGEARLGVKNHGADEKSSPITQKKDYQQVELEFTTGADATIAAVFCSVPGNAGAALFDEVSIRAK
jgi:hypothetical protein